VRRLCECIDSGDEYLETDQSTSLDLLPTKKTYRAIRLSAPPATAGVCLAIIGHMNVMTSRQPREMQGLLVGCWQIVQFPPPKKEGTMKALPEA
jgi:hypothetical protein